MKTSIDINADLGEGYNDRGIMTFISSANIACGGHYGTEESMRAAITLAQENGVSVGAHISYPDKENFGRKSMNISRKNLEDSLRSQYETFHDLCLTIGTSLHHVKPHGALYNDMAKDKELSHVILSIIKEYNPDTRVYALASSCTIEVAKAMSVTVIQEAFSDRKYEGLELISRAKPNAVLTSEVEIISNVNNFIHDKVVDHEGRAYPVNVDSICIHGDTPAALQHAMVIHSFLKSRGIEITAP